MLGDLEVSRNTVTKYRNWAADQGFLAGELPDRLVATFGFSGLLPLLLTTSLSLHTL